MKNITEEEFENIINKYSKELFVVAYNYVRDKDISEDIIQDAFIKLYKTNKNFTSDDYLKNWLIRVTINLSLNELKKKKKEVISNNYIYNLPNNSFKNNNEELYKCICALKNEYKTIIFLYYYDKHSLKEIAGILNISESNVTTRLSRARNKLKNIILERRKNNGR